MNRAPAVRGVSLVAFRVLAVAAAGASAGALLASGCSLNTSGITDPGPSNGLGTGGDTTPIDTGSGGSTTDAGNSAVGGAGGLGGRSGGAGGAPSPDGQGGAGVVGTGGSNGSGGVTIGTGGTVGGTGGATGDGVGGATGTGGAGVGGTTGTGGRGAGGMGTGGMGTGGMGVGGMGTGGNFVVNGCADGTREAFTNIQMFPSIAGCSGGWSVAGVVTVASNTPMCARTAGNDGTRPNGNGCTVEDLCAEGWHVCRGASELTALNVTCAQAQLPPVGGPAGAGVLFFATRQRGVQGNTCNADDLIGTNDVHGCGNFGLPEDRNCAPLDRHLSHTECDQAQPWSCGNNNTATTEALLVTKPGSAAGGVLCCH